MEEFGITVDALERSLAEDQQAARAIRYQDALGHVWDGHGDVPEWLRRAVDKAGNTVNFLLRADRPSPQPGGISKNRLIRTANSTP